MKKVSFRCEELLLQIFYLYLSEYVVTRNLSRYTDFAELKGATASMQLPNLFYIDPVLPSCASSQGWHFLGFCLGRDASLLLTIVSRRDQLEKLPRDQVLFCLSKTAFDHYLLALLLLRYTPIGWYRSMVDPKGRALENWCICVLKNYVRAYM